MSKLVSVYTMSVVLISSDSETEVTSTIRFCRKECCGGRCVECIVGKGRHLISELEQLVSSDSEPSSSSTQRFPMVG